MNAMRKIEWTVQDSWIATLTTLLPLWLLSVAILTEGFPDPPISLALALVAFVLAIGIGIVLVWVGWLKLDLILYSLFPLVLLYIFDEIATNYKTPFILVCALILSVGIVSAQRSSSEEIRWRIWLVINIVVWVLASHALQAYWHMIGNLVFDNCFPYMKGCLPLAGTEVPWWVLFFTP
jgi:hypothetical protein